MTTLTVHTNSHISRPLKVLVPLIQSELERGDAAGHDHYRRAGEMLIEAKDQIPHGGWTRWLTKNFDLSPQTARVYMQWARLRVQNARGASVSEEPASLRQMRGDTERLRDHRDAQKHFQRTLREVARDDFAQERQRAEAEVALHRKLAEELVDLGYRALATKLHPDRGGTREAMTRLNKVRDELKQVARTRRFV